MSTTELKISIEAKTGATTTRIDIEVTSENGILSATAVAPIDSSTQIAHAKNAPDKQVINPAPGNDDKSQTQHHTTEAGQQDAAADPVHISVTLDGETLSETGAFSSAETEFALDMSNLSKQAQTYQYIQNLPQASLQQPQVVPSIFRQSEWEQQNFGDKRRSCRTRNAPPSYEAASSSFMKKRSKCTRKGKLVRSRKS